MYLHFESHLNRICVILKTSSQLSILEETLKCYGLILNDFLSFWFEFPLKGRSLEI